MIPPESKHVRRLLATAALLAAPAVAQAQAARGSPGIRTPARAADPAPGDAMAGVKVAPGEIDFAPKPGAYEVSFNLDDADLPDLVKAIGNITGRRFILSGKLRAIKATVHSPAKISAAEAYQAFLSILQSNGMTVIPHGRFYKIVETPGVAGETTEVVPPTSPVPDEDRYLTRLVRLSHLDASEASTVLAKLKSKDADIIVYAPGNLLIITDSGANIRRMLRILEEIDVGGATAKLWVEPGGVLYGGNDVATSIGGVPSNLEGLALGIRGPTIPGAQNILGTGLSLPAFGAVLSAMAKTGDANVLATPHLLATDNTKAEISIGDNIPLQTNANTLTSLSSALGGSQSAASGLLGGGLGGLAMTSQRQDVGTKIAVTPHLNDSNQVRLEVDEEISEASAPQGSLGVVPIKKRTATTTLVVRDQQTVILGGLMRDAATTSETKIPGLGDIPLLGFLFKQTQKTRQKSNLLLILTPYIIRDQDDLRAIFERKMQERQEIIDRYFVFGDARWTPPQDYRKTNGLVEDIRQSVFEMDEKRRLDEESKRAVRKVHQPVQPIERPMVGGRPSAEPDRAPPGMPPRAPGVSPPKAGSAGPRRAPVDRVE
jgi:type II secretory pathway component GspD/PulD (secretin)